MACNNLLYSVFLCNALFLNWFFKVVHDYNFKLCKLEYVFFILKKLFILYKQSINGKYLKWEIND